MNYVKKREKIQGRYSVGLKRKIAKAYLSGKASYAILAEEHGLRDKTVVKEFVKWYRHKLAMEPNFEIQFDTKLEDLSKTKEELAARIKELEAQLKHAELKTEMLETIIDLASEELNIDIVKKSDTKQSKE
jgi:transposase-like protein